MSYSQASISTLLSHQGTLRFCIFQSSNGAPILDRYAPVLAAWVSLGFDALDACSQSVGPQMLLTDLIILLILIHARAPPKQDLFSHADGHVTCLSDLSAGCSQSPHSRLKFFVALSMRILACLLLIINAGRSICQTTHNVTVGFKGSFYDPPTTNALEGDTVIFVFAGQLHGVTQSSFWEPCSPLPGGFSSGLVGLNGSDIEPPTWSLTISNASEPIWFFCESTKPVSHCASGMVGTINASPDQYEHFTSAAKAVTRTPKPTPSVALTGIGAFATVNPTTVTQPDSTASGVGDSEEESGRKRVPVGAIAGGSAGGAVLVMLIIVLIFMLYRQRNNRRVVEGYDFNGEKERTPSTPLFKDGVSQPAADSGLSDSESSRANSQMRRQASSSALSSDLENASRGAPKPPPVINIVRENKIQAQNLPVPISQHTYDTVTMADAFNLSPPRHPYAQTQTQTHYTQPPLPLVSPTDLVLDQSAPNVHEIAKEVAALLRLGRLLPPGLTGPSPPPASVPVTKSRISQSRVPRRLPNPAHYLRPSPVLEEPDSPALPRYER